LGQDLEGAGRLMGAIAKATHSHLHRRGL